MYEDQAASLRRQVDKSRQIKRAKTIAVVSGKGGVGKSNFVLNFAIKLGEENKSVLILDLDIGMGNIDILLGLQAKYSIVQMYENNWSFDDIIEKGPRNVSYVAAGSGLTDIFTQEATMLDHFLKQYDEITTEYDYILFDMGAGVTDQSLFYILAADECFLITTPEPTAMMDAYAMIKHIHKNNDGLPLYLIVNRIDSIKEGKLVVKRLQKVAGEFLGKSLNALGLIPFDKMVSKAVIAQVPFTLFDPSMRASRAIKLIAKQYLSKTIDLDQKSPSLFTVKLRRFIDER